MVGTPDVSAVTDGTDALSAMVEKGDVKPCVVSDTVAVIKYPTREPGSVSVALNGVLPTARPLTVCEPINCCPSLAPMASCPGLAKNSTRYVSPGTDAG